jgi:hypothetical protein
MKKLLLLLCFLLGILWSGVFMTDLQAQNESMTVPYISTPIAIDGVIDDWPLTIDYTPLTHYINKTKDWIIQDVEWSKDPFDPSDLSAQMLVAYDMEYFYLFLEVTDDIDAKQDAKWKSDDVELFFNPDLGNDIPFTGDSKNYIGSDGVQDALQITFPRDTAAFDGGPGWVIRDWDYEFAVVNETSSYTFEIKVPLDSLFTDHANIGDWVPDRTPLIVQAEPGYSFGFDVMIIDYDGNTTFDDYDRDGHLHWSNESGNDLAYMNTELFGTITLEDNVGLDNTRESQFTITPNPFRNDLRIRGLENGHSIRIYNVLGQRVLDVRDAGREELILNVNSLDSGIYILGIYNEQEVISTSKIIKE